MSVLSVHRGIDRLIKRIADEFVTKDEEARQPTMWRAKTSITKAT